MEEKTQLVESDAEKNKVFGILAYLGILVIIPIVAAKDSPFARYHANQGLILLLCWVGLTIITVVVGIILGLALGMLGLDMLAGLFGVGINVLHILMVILMIIGIINAAQGQCKPLPVIGKYNLLK